MKNPSDLTRCIIVPVNTRLNIPRELTPTLIGEAIRHYSKWFSAHADEEIDSFRKVVEQAADSDEDIRVRTNYACLTAAFPSFLRSLRELDSSPAVEARVGRAFHQAVKDSWNKHADMVAAIKDTIPVGNLAYCILKGWKKGAFDLTKEVKNLDKHGGTIWKGDLCLRKEELVRFVRQQVGYHDWLPNRITRHLKDLNALVLQEEDTATVHLRKDTPRVYRIRQKVLEDNAQKY